MRRQPFTVGEWEVFPLEGRIVRDGQSERLRPKAMDVLCLLASRPGEVVERDIILGEVWGRTAVTDEPLTATIGELRRVLGDRRGDYRYIETIPKRGYRLVAATELSSPGAAETGHDANPSHHACGPPAGQGHLRRGRGIAVALALAVLLAAAGFWLMHPESAAELPDSVAVLPFATPGAAGDDRYFGDGLAQEILTTLSGIDGLRVAARNSAFEFRDRRGDLDALRQTLGVDAVLDGSIRREGDRLRIQVQLMDTRSGFNLWAQTYDRRLGDAFALQSEIARSIADQLSVAFLDAGRLSARGAHGDSQAYLAYLRGSYLYETARDPEGLDAARLHLEEAVSRDAGFALARAKLAGVWTRIGDYGYAAAAEAYERGRGQAQAALALSPDLAEAHLMLGWVRMYYDWDWEGARAALTRALDLAPGDAFIIAANAALNYHLGQLEPAVKLAEMAVERDPLRASGHYNLAYFRYAAGDFEGAGRALDRAETLVPDYPRAGLLRVQIDLEQGDVERAASRVETHPLLALMADALVAHARGDAGRAGAALAQMEREHGETSAYQIAGVYAWMGRTDEAFRWLQRAYELRDPGMADLRVDRLLAPLHGDPRFDELLEKMGFVKTA
jgi:TolB-like protein/DNA-binding winged helix-turn-helix (wHTH) protein